MESWSALPSASLGLAGPISCAFLKRGIADFQDAGHFLLQLPYGRNTQRSDFTLVLPEGRGTCSTKHALLAALAREQRLPVSLMLGIYEMHELNTPGVGVILARYGLERMPEAHCYCSYEGKRIDLTRSGVAPGAPLEPFLAEEVIAPEQIGAYKVQRHQAFLWDWVGTEEQMRHRSFAELWKIREACIEALEQ